MINVLLGCKIDQTQTFTKEGKRIPVTVVQAGPCWITKIEDNPLFKNIQLGFTVKKHISRGEAGHLKKAGLTQRLRFLRSIRLSNPSDLGGLSPGQEIKIDDVFAPGDKICVIGVSKGKGFAGVVKRHGFSGGPRTHGQSDRERAPGSIGQTTTPGRVYKGKRMAGRMGGEKKTITGLKVIEINNENNLLTLKGLVPGAKNSLLIIQKETR